MIQPTQQTKLAYKSNGLIFPWLLTFDIISKFNVLQKLLGPVWWEVVLERGLGICSRGLDEGGGGRG